VPKVPEGCLGGFWHFWHLVTAFDTINKLELGKRDAQPRTIRKLAAALGVEPKEPMKGG